MIVPNLTENKKNFIRTRIPNEILQQVIAYIEWDELHSMSEFFSMAAMYVLRNDRKWVQYKKLNDISS